MFLGDVGRDFISNLLHRFSWRIELLVAAETFERQRIVFGDFQFILVHIGPTVGVGQHPVYFDSCARPTCFHGLISPTKIALKIYNALLCNVRLHFLSIPRRREFNVSVNPESI